MDLFRSPPPSTSAPSDGKPFADSPTKPARQNWTFGVVELRRAGTEGGHAEWIGGPLDLQAARNEWVDGVLNVEGGRELQISNLTHAGGEGNITFDRVRVYVVREVAVELKSVGAVRDSGPSGTEAAIQKAPQALVPLEGKNGVWKLPTGRDAAKLVYIEVKPPVSAAPGLYESTLTLLGKRGEEKLPLRLLLDDLALSEVPDFSLYGQVRWDDLVRLFPETFMGIEPRLLSRLNARHVVATERLDQIVRLAREHRLDVGFDRLTPTVKYTPREGLQVDWSDYDSVVIPWLTGEIDPSREGLSAFPLPIPEEVARGAVRQGDWARAAISHFEQRRLLGKMLLPRGLSESALGQGELAEKVRLPGDLVDLPAQSEEGLRQVAWQAFAEGRRAARAGDVAPGVSSPSQPEVANRAVWFYPGDWFGTRGAAVPSIGIKWARRAQQDREIFELARRRGANVLAQTVARRATRIGENVPTFGGDLLTPTISRETWREGLRIVRAAAVARVPGTQGPTPGMELDEQESLQRWSVSLDRPLVLPGPLVYQTQSVGETTLQFELDLVDTAAEVRIVRVPDGWKQLDLNRRQAGVTLTARIDPETIRYPVTRDYDAQGRPLPENGTLLLETVTSPERITARREVLLPVMAVLPAPVAPVLDGKINDWTNDELIHVGPLVRLLDRPAVQGSATLRAGTDTNLLAKWDGNHMYLAFRAEGVRADPSSPLKTNFIAQDKGRAWGEDLCRISLRVGPQTLHLLAKPSGLTVEEGMGKDIHYATTVNNGTWRGELRIPAPALGFNHYAPGQTIEFNLVRHEPSTGESASLAGPIDQDYQPTRALLYLVESTPTIK